MLEYLSVGLAVLATIGGTLAWVYKRGHIDGIDSACEKRIKDDIRGLEKAVTNIAKEKNESHKEIFCKISDVDSKVDQIKGSVDVMKDLLNGHLTKSS